MRESSDEKLPHEEPVNPYFLAMAELVVRFRVWVVLLCLGVTATFALAAVRDACRRIGEAGYEVSYDELLEASA